MRQSKLGATMKCNEASSLLGPPSSPLRRTSGPEDQKQENGQVNTIFFDCNKLQFSFGLSIKSECVLIFSRSCCNMGFLFEINGNVSPC
ncbi:uncharacterized protein LOC133790624 isoform X2 [Humulus lupulus]|uniref:uncharacterized protein LOC133790624 isoform X2 n=1 Tax=Humulus lupulus TaxID=3486 RepID=UPI002B404BEB|nr:uncharacterized protein LOC133790624 isoform X2 [Humulus lupulus]